MTTQQNANNKVLQLNVGFLLKEGVGISRTFSFDETNVLADDIELSRLLGSLELTRTAQGILAQGRLEGQMLDDCVRCLSEAMIEVTVNLSEHFVYPPSDAADDERTVSEGAEIDLAPIIRDDSILATPMHLLCRPDCLGLCSQCGQNLNEAQCECDHSVIDPRLAALKSLLDE